MTTTKELIDAIEFVNECEFPVLFFAGVGHPAGCKIALGPDTDLPFDLGELRGPVVDGEFVATNLTCGPGAYDWKLDDWNGNIIYSVRIFDDEKTWREQIEEE